VALITNDYRCMGCNHVEERRVERAVVPDQKCGICGADMKQLMGGPTTTFRFGDRSATKSRKAVSLRDRGSSP